MTTNIDTLTPATQLTSKETGANPPPHAVPPAPRGSHEERNQPRRKRLTAETRACFERLRALAEPLRLRIVLDEEGWPVIPGTYGRIECADRDGCQLVVYCDHPRLFKRLREIRTVEPDRTGDGEIQAIFAPEAFDEVVRVIRAWRKPGLSSAQARVIGSRTRFQAGSRTALRGTSAA